MTFILQSHPSKLYADEVVTIQRVLKTKGYAVADDDVSLVQMLLMKPWQIQSWLFIPPKHMLIHIHIRTDQLHMEVCVQLALSETSRADCAKVPERL